MNPRERFLCVLYTAPLYRADAIAVFTGEDGEARTMTAIQCLMRGVAPGLWFSGGREEPDAGVFGAESCMRKALEAGVDPARIALDRASMNTHQQAAALVARAGNEGWTRVVLVASSYHLPRAFLSCVRAMQDATDDAAKALRPTVPPPLHIVPLGTSAPGSMDWWTPPPGLGRTRLQLLGQELDKITKYADKGHVASYDDGVQYLREWGGVPSSSGNGAHG